MLKIEEFLKEKEDGIRLLTNLSFIKEKAEPLLAKINEIFPEYSPHDMHHSERILETYNFLIPDSLFEKMNSYELYFLIASTYLHDIGMVKSEFEKIANKEGIQLDKITDLPNFIREVHHETAEKVCILESANLGINYPFQAEIIGRICRGHRKEDLHDLKLFEHDKKYLTYSINVALLASLLRNGDELDLTFKRTPYIVYEIAPPKDNISKEEWEKHLSISGVSKDSEDDLKIKCSARCESPKIHRSLKGLELKINKGIEDLSSHLYHYREVIKDVPRKFVIDIESIGYEQHDFKFSLQEVEVISLLMGDKLYERKEECLRELLKNAVDSCRLKKFRSKKEGKFYKPEIKFELKSDELIVSDNGTGMNKDFIENYFTKIGKSYYTSKEFIEEKPNFLPISELGIGVLSYFMIADRILVETKTSKDNAISLEIDDVSNYFFVKSGFMTESGTIIFLHLKKEIQNLDLKSEIDLFASQLEFSVKVVSQGEEVTITKNEFISNKLLKKTKIFEGLTKRENTKNKLEEILGEFNLTVHELNINKNYVRGKIGFLIINDFDFENSFPNESKRSVFKPICEIESPNNSIYKPISSLTLYPAEGISKLSYLGIHVCYENLSIPWFKSVLFADFNLTKNKLNINIARNKCIMDEKKKDFNDFIEISLIECIKNYLDTIKCERDFLKYAYLFMNTFIRFQSTEDRIYDKKFLNEYYYLKQLTGNGISYLKYDESIFDTDKKIILLTDVPLDSDLVKILPSVTGFKEDHIYFVYTKNLYNLITYFIKKKEYMELVSFCDFLKTEGEYLINFNENNGFDTNKYKYEMKIKNFNNPTLSRYIGFISSEGFVFNMEHKFVSFIYLNKEKILKEGGILKNFLKNFSTPLFPNNIDSIIYQQRILLTDCTNKGLISRTDTDNIILQENDFVKYLYGINL